MANSSKGKYDEYLSWVQKREEALAKIEVKLLAMKQIAIYVASRTLDEEEVSMLQERIDLLQQEITTIDQATQPRLIQRLH